MRTLRTGDALRALAVCTVLATGCRASQAGALGQAAWVSHDTLFSQALPEGKPRVVGVAAGLRRPAFSPSGRWLAVFASDGLRLARTDGSGGEKLAGPEATDFAWAPTDDRVAYLAGGNLLVTRAGGIGALLVDRTGGPRVTGVRWSPDAQWLAFALESPSPIGKGRPGAPAGAPASALWRMPARGGAPTPLPVSDSSLGAALSPTQLPPSTGTSRAQASPGGEVLMRLRDGRHVLRAEAAAPDAATLRLALAGEEVGQVLARLERPGAASGGSGAAPARWADLVAYSPR